MILYEFWSRGIILTVLWGILCMTSTKAEAWNARSTTEFLYYIFSLEGKSMTDRLRSDDQLGLAKYSNLFLSHLSIISCKIFTLCRLCTRLLAKHVFHFNGCSGGDFPFLYHGNDPTIIRHCFFMWISRLLFDKIYPTDWAKPNISAFFFSSLAVLLKQRLQLCYQ